MSEKMKDLVPYIDESAAIGHEDMGNVSEEQEQEEQAKKRLFEIMDVLDTKDGFWVKQGGKLQKGLEWNVLPHDGGERTYYTWVDDKGQERNGRIKTDEFIQWQKEGAKKIEYAATESPVIFVDKKFANGEEGDEVPKSSRFADIIPEEKFDVREELRKANFSVRARGGIYEDTRKPKQFVEQEEPSVVVDSSLEMLAELRKEINAEDAELRKKAEQEKKENALSEEEARKIISTVTEALEILTKDGKMSVADKQRARTLQKISQWKEKVQEAFNVIDKKKDPKNSKTIGPVWYRAKVLMQDLEMHEMNLEQKDVQKNETLEQALDQLRTVAQAEREKIIVEAKPKSSKTRQWISTWAARLTLASLGAFAVDNSNRDTQTSYEAAGPVSAQVEGRGISSLEIEHSKPEITVEKFLENYEKISDPRSTEIPEIKIDSILSKAIKEKHNGQIPESFSVLKTHDRKAVKLVFEGGSTIVANPTSVQSGDKEYWRLHKETPTDAIGRLRGTLTEMSKKYPEIFGNKKVESFENSQSEKTPAQAVKVVERKLAEAEKNQNPKKAQRLLEDSLNIFKDIQKKYFKKPEIKRTRAVKQADRALEIFKKSIGDILDDYPSIEEGELGNSR